MISGGSFTKSKAELEGRRKPPLSPSQGYSHMNDFAYLTLQLVKVAALFLSAWALVYAFMLIAP
jgi:hypothetical protein